MLRFDQQRELEQSRQPIDPPARVDLVERRKPIRERVRLARKLLANARQQQLLTSVFVHDAQRVELLYKTVLGRAPAKDEAELALKFVELEASQKKPDVVAPATPWQCGYGNYDEAAAQVKDFKPLPHFAENMYRGGAAMTYAAFPLTSVSLMAWHATQETPSL